MRFHIKPSPTASPAEYPPMKDRSLHLDPTLVLRVLGAIAAALVLLSLAGQIAIHVLHLEVKDIVAFFDVGRERNLPTGYAVFLLTTCGLILAIIALLHRRLREPEWRPWSLLAAGFFVMAYDEGFQIHEHFLAPMQSVLGGGNLGMLNYAWIVPAGAMVVVLGLYFLPFVMRLPRRTRRGVLLAAFFYLGGCLGVEALGGGYDAAYGVDNLPYNLLATFEEALEMLGLVVFLSTLLGHLGAEFGEIRIRVNPELQPQPNIVKFRRSA